MFAIGTTIYKRPTLTNIVLDYYKERAEKFGFKLIVCGDAEEAKEGVEYVAMSNEGLGRKHNAITLKAKELDLNGVVIIGSDDLISDNLLKYYSILSGDLNNYLGSHDCYFYSVKLDELIYFINNAQTIGAGRFFSRKVLEKVGWKPWDDTLNKCLDGYAKKFLSDKGVGERWYETTDFDGMILDIKSGYNLTSYESLKILSQTVDKSLIEKYFGIEIITKIKELADEIRTEEQNAYEERSITGNK